MAVTTTSTKLHKYQSGQLLLVHCTAAISADAHGCKVSATNDYTYIWALFLHAIQFCGCTLFENKGNINS